ncbi:DsbA family protein [Pseudidiomarina insulisalsae]|nr:thioredoxin domain-containing protein [Pseudidiomarina insulisalsae]
MTYSKQLTQGFLIALSTLVLLGCQPASETSDNATPEVGEEQRSTENVEQLTQPLMEDTTDFIEGRDYRVLDTALTLGDFEKAPGERGFVIEFLWPGCPHCQDLNPTVNAFALEYTDVALIKRAAPANERWAYDARVFYTLRDVAETNLDDELIEFYERVRVNENRLPTPEDIQAFLAEHGIDAEAFATAFEDSVQTDKLRLVMEDMMDAEITSVPMLVVNGKYVVTAPAPHSQEESKRYFALINYLLELQLD